VFEQAFSAANWTKPSTASLFTGRLPHHHGCLVGHLRREKAGSVVADLLPDELTTFASCSSKRLVHLRPDREQAHHRALRLRPGFDRYGYERLGQLGSRISAAPPGRPFLAFAHIMGPHEPYDMPQDKSFAPYRDRFGSFASAIDFTTFDYKRQTSFSDDDLGRARALYDAKLNWVDELQIGPLLAGLHRKGLYDACWLVVTSDHGEELGEHGKIGHGEVLYNESLHVPLIVKPPARLPRHEAGTRVATRVSTISLYPTLAEIATGASVPSDGLSLMAALRGEPLEDRPLIAEYGRFQKGRLHAATIMAGLAQADPLLRSARAVARVRPRARSRRALAAAAERPQPAPAHGAARARLQRARHGQRASPWRRPSRKTTRAISTRSATASDHHGGLATRFQPIASTISDQERHAPSARAIPDAVRPVLRQAAAAMRRGGRQPGER
jgi:hypothetical protein